MGRGGDGKGGKGYGIERGERGVTGMRSRRGTRRVKGNGMGKVYTGKVRARSEGEEGREEGGQERKRREVE